MLTILIVSFTVELRVVEICNMPKSHYTFNTSKTPGALNDVLKGKNGIIELAGIMHNAVSSNVKHDGAMQWNYHALEGVPEGTFDNMDDRFFPDSIIEDHLLESVVDKITSQFVHYPNAFVQSDGSGRLVGVFEGKYFPKEEGCAREKRNAGLQEEITNGFSSGSLIPDCLVRALARNFDRLGFEYIIGPAEGEATVVAQYNCGLFDFAIMTSEDSDARALMLWSNPASKKYLIFPRRQYQNQKDSSGWFYGSHIVQGVIVSDEDYLAPIRPTPGSTKEYDISMFTAYDRLLLHCEAGSDYYHEQGVGHAAILDHIAQQKGPNHLNISPVTLIRSFCSLRKLPVDTTQKHLDMYMAYVLHPVSRLLDPAQPKKWTLTNMVRYDINETISTWPVRDLVEDALPKDSRLRELIVVGVQDYSPATALYRFRNCHSCSDLNPNRANVASVPRQIEKEHPALERTSSVLANVGKLPRMDPEVVLQYSQRTEIHSSGYNRGQRRLFTVLKNIKSKPALAKNFAYAFAENNLAGNPTVIFITFPVPRHLQLTETHQCWVKCAIGMKYDENEGGETFQVLRILGFFCNCTLMLSSDCSHGVRKPIYF